MATKHSIVGAFKPKAYNKPTKHSKTLKTYQWQCPDVNGKEWREQDKWRV
jgi:hypothetical protein